MTVYADLFRYRELFLNLFRRDLQVKYRGSVLGLFWTLVNPLVLMGVYTLLFSILLRAVSIEHFPLFVLAGLLTWVFFQSAVQTSSGSLLAHASLVKQVRFPRQLLPLSVVGSNLVTFFAMLAVILPFNLVLIPETRSTFWVALPLIVPLVALVCGLAVLVASANVFFRDIEHLVATIMLPWFVLTPIFYTFDQLPGVAERQWVVDVMHYGNFLSPFVLAIRDPLFFGEMPAGVDVVYSVVAALAALGLGAVVFRRVDDRLAAEL
ncbi:MAG TPA: ABC transporter permease [Gaiellaceae bacterium]|nr:ABC transporter permease [Gaiellaceae bacterium]